MNRRSPPPDVVLFSPPRLAAAGLLLAMLASAAGCQPPLGAQPYGRAYGVEAERSMNGVSVLARMIEQRGHRVDSWERLSPRLQRADCLIWFPDHFGAPQPQEQSWLEQWLEKGNRTLVYVGRDFDATIPYWERRLAQAAPDEAPEYRRRLAQAKAQHARRRATMPGELDNRWFLIRRDQPQRRIRSLTSDSGWADSVDPAKLDIRLEGRLEPRQTVPAPPTEAAPPRPAPPPPAAAAAEDEEDSESGSRYGGYQASLRQELLKWEVLLESQGDPLIYRLQGSRWRGSQVIVVANGSFLLNLPLVNHEHRKLATRLIDEAIPGTDQEVVFLESGDYIPIRSTEPQPRPTTGQEWRWPVAPLSVHLLVALVLACFVFFPIFGRPREIRDDSLSDFGRHVDELGRLLAQTNDAQYARSRVEHYFSGGRRDGARSAKTRDSES